MKKFAVRIEEVYGKTVIVEAENIEEAKDMANEAYFKGTISLDFDNISAYTLKESCEFPNGIVPDGADISYYEILRKEDSKDAD